MYCLLGIIHKFYYLRIRVIKGKMLTQFNTSFTFLIILLFLQADKSIQPIEHNKEYYK
jgi:hypothetical protein